MKKRLLSLFSLLLLAGSVVAQVDYTPINTGAKTRTNRMVGSISVGGDTYTLPTGTRNAYTDLTGTKTFTVTAGETVTLGMTQSAGSWMNAFVYVDMDNNGFTAGVESNGYTPTGDLVSFSFYSNSSTDDASGYNSAGSTITGDNRSTLTLPSWTVPADLTPGEYRIRFKYDWNKIEPAGVNGNYFGNSFMGHGGEIIDAKLVVTGAEGPDPDPETPTYPYVVTNVSNLNYSCLYTIDQPHHTHGATAWAVSDALKSNVDLGKEIDANDTAQQFAFFSNDGGTTVYLYHPASKKFINLDGTLGKSPKNPLTFSNGAASYPNTFVVKFDNNHYINVGGERQMIIDGWSTADGGNSCRITAIAEFDPNEALTTALVGKTEEALALTGVGYPVADAEERTALVEALAAFVNEATQENKDNLVAKLTAFAASTNVQMPESGKAYIFANKQKNGNLYYFTYTEAAVNVTSDASNATPFVCKVLENGKFVFVNNAGKYLVWRGKNAGTNEVKGYVDAYDTSEEAWTDIELTKVVEGDKVDAGNEETLFGCLYLKGRRNDPSAEKDHFAYTVIKSDCTYDQASVPFFNATYSSAMMLVEATYPNKPELKAADGLDVAAIATYSAPFATVVPEGVTAWYAQSESDNTVKLTEVEGAIPANTGVVLTSETTGTVTMVPAAAEELATVSGNLLSEAAAAGDYEVEAETNAYVIGKADDVVAFYPLSATNRTIAQSKSFLVLPTASPVVKMNFGGESTAIETVEKVDANAPIYDLSGRRVVNMTNGGVYIQNGKKFIVK